MTKYICSYCGSERKNSNSWRNHERLCKSNPNRQVSYFSDPENRKKFKFTPENQYTKAKKLGLPKPEISEETRKKMSENTKRNNKNRSPEILKKISDSMKLAHAEGRVWNIGKSRWNNEPSYPEKFFMQVIQNHFLDKEYDNEFPIGIYSADFCWPHLKKVIEIDGEQHYRFLECIERDKRKDEFLKSQGYKILRISWKEMFNNTKEKIQEAYDFIHN